MSLPEFKIACPTCKGAGCHHGNGQGCGRCETMGHLAVVETSAVERLLAEAYDRGVNDTFDTDGALIRARKAGAAEERERIAQAIERERDHPGRGWNDYNPDSVSSTSHSILTGMKEGLATAVNVARAALEGDRAAQ